LGTPAMADKAVKSRALLKVLGKALETQGESLVAKFKGVVRFNIDGVEFLLDLKNGSGSIQEGGEGAAELTVTVSDDNFAKLVEGSLNPQQAFMTGKLKIKGAMGLAMKLQPVLKAARPKSKL